VIVPQSSPKATQLKAFITFALSAPAQAAIKKLIFAPMPASVIKAAKKTLATVHS
jgi:ABC-type phosphate transport system substrate-binding protein